MKAPQSILELRNLIMPARKKVINKSEKPHITNLKYNTLNEHQGKEVVFQNTVYNIKQKQSSS